MVGAFDGSNQEGEVLKRLKRTLMRFWAYVLKGVWS